jgi:hypothetical protein
MVAFGEAARQCWTATSFCAGLQPSALAERGFAEIGSAAAWERGLACFLHCLCLELTGPISELSARGQELMREAGERDDRSRPRRDPWPTPWNATRRCSGSDCAIASC